MDLPLPDWLDDRFLTESLRREEGKEDIQVTAVSGSPAAPPGSNFGGCVFRVKVDYKVSGDEDVRSLSIIVKEGVTDGAIAECYQDTLRVCEPRFYYAFLPAASKLSKMFFLPKVFFSPKSDSVIILEDLKDQGYVMVDRSQPFDLAHCRLYVAAVAELHAVSVPVFEQRPEFQHSLGAEKVFMSGTAGAEHFKNLEIAAMSVLADKIEEAGLTRFTKYCGFIRDVSHRLWDMLHVAHKPSAELNTLNQGDPWAPNMMFRYDDGEVSAIKLLDFQALRFGSPVNDLVFFLWSSASHDVRRRHVEELSEVYLDALNGKLQELNLPQRLSRQHLRDGLRLLSPLKLHMVALMQPLNADTSKPLDVNALIANSGNLEGVRMFFSGFYSEDYCQRDLPMMLEQLELEGVFHVLENWTSEPASEL